MNAKTKTIVKIVGISLAIIMSVFVLVTIPVYSWFAKRNLNVYAPITTSTSLYIGAGNNEDIRYLYFDGIDVENRVTYKDYVFSISGEFVKHYKIQLAFTTNNQFTFELYRATDDITKKSSSIEGSVVYTTHDDNEDVITYYIQENGFMRGIYLNQDGNSILGIDDLNNPLYQETYGDYENVNKYAVPLYWQTLDTIDISTNDNFPHYFILRVKTNNKDLNDRETDIICIAAKDFTSADHPSGGD